MRCLIGLLICFSASAATDLLKWMDATAQQQLAARDAVIKGIRTPAEAEARQKAVRAKILQLIGGLPDYKGPLNPRITGAIKLEHYTIEKVLFESLPNYFVSANLYRPNAPGQYPGVLFTMGHWESGKAAAQLTAANLALKGFIVLAFDPVGQGERQQAYDSRLRGSLVPNNSSTEQHNLAGAQAILAGEHFARYRIWDAKRALDYLLSRPEVIKEKIGCTGCSGGGTLTTYISALDNRIKVAAPACYINTWKLLFTGPTGDAEQSITGFLKAGLDLPDYIELFAPKPWLIGSTEKDFFPLEGARIAYEEARRWYEVFGASDKIKWVVGPGGHGTPVEVRQGIYDWMIRWLKDGKGSAKEEKVPMQPDVSLWATQSGEVDGREIYQIIAEGAQARKSKQDFKPVLAALVGTRQQPKVRELAGERIAIESEPGFEIEGKLYTPAGTGRKPAVVLINGGKALAQQFVAEGAVVLDLTPRGTPIEPRRGGYVNDSITNLRALVIGRDLAAMRALDIAQGAAALAARSDVDPKRIRGMAKGTAAIWLLMAKSLEPAIGKVWVDRMPANLNSAMNKPIHRNLHDIVIPGFALHWDIPDLVPANSIVTDPTDWLGVTLPNVPNAKYSYFETPPQPLIRALLN